MRSNGKRNTTKLKNKGTAGKNRTSKKTHKNNIVAKMLALLCLLSVVVFEISLIKFNMLPTKYMFVALIAFTPLGVLLFLGLFFNKVKKKLRILVGILSVVLMLVSFVGTSYITGTMSFLDKISSIGQTFSYEKFYIIVKADSDIDDIDDLANTEIGILSVANESYSNARNELKELIECEYENVVDLDKLGSELLNGSKKSLFLSETNYSLLDEDTQGYKEKTKVIYTIKIKTIQEDSARRVDITEEPFNIYLSGIDTYGGIENVSRSDVNMIITINPKTNKILLTSIPRDCVVTLPTFGERDKLTHAGIYGINESIGSIENLMGIEINYYLKVNFSAVENLVNAINGIDVESDYNFTAGGNSFSIGMNYMNGTQALSFSRERHSFVDGDFQRVKNQQKVIEGIITKITSSSTLLLNYNSILSAVGGSMDTSIAPEEIKSLVKMQLADMPNWEFESSSIDQGGDASLTGYSYPNQELYMFVPNEDAVIEAADKINAVMNKK